MDLKNLLPVQLLGAPTADSTAEGARPYNVMEGEHCNKRSGFGESDRKFADFDRAGNHTTPRDEWLHVVYPDRAPVLFTGKKDDDSPEEHPGCGNVREKIPISEIVEPEK
eukprot:SAG11_NODE_13858_length_636_cov_0.754190_1_plen_109_part_10